jgi:hypothetical protein
MDRQFILDEIRRTAEGNGGKPLGRQRFEIETGIKPHEWMRFWARFGDAQREAGHAANSLQRAFDEDAVMGRVVELTRELKRFPTHGDLRVKRTLDPSFPSKGVFGRFRKHELISKALAFCAAHPGNEDVASVCASLGAKAAQAEARAEPDSSKDGFVYLIKSGRFYKIGKTNHVGRRERELAIQLPEDVRTVHYIRTDDPHGIESYWHARFHPKRKNGEWFELSTDDVAAFRRRKFM